MSLVALSMDKMERRQHLSSVPSCAVLLPPFPVYICAALPYPFPLSFPCLLFLFFFLSFSFFLLSGSASELVPDAGVGIFTILGPGG